MCSLHWQKSKTRKYGLITMPDDKLELKPLEEDDDDDEDMTVFDRTKPRPMNSQLAPQKKSSKQFCKCPCMGAEYLVGSVISTV